MLGYKDTADAIQRYVDNEDKGVGEIPTPQKKAKSVQYVDAWYHFIDISFS